MGRIGRTPETLEYILNYRTFVILAFLMPLTLEANDSTPSRSTGNISTAESIKEPALTINEPMFFVVGKDDDTTAEFQLSFKYRVFAEDGFVVDRAGWLEDLHVAYTQTSLWNLSEESAPFEDSTYRPSVFWEFRSQSNPFGARLLRVGYEHASNGQDEDRSRSIDTLFLMPAWSSELFGKQWTIAPKFVGYLAKGSENDDIADYRGYSDLILRVGTEDSLLISSLYRLGDNGRTTIQLDLSYPIRKRIFERTGGYLFLRAFKGYGETLETYNRKQDLQVRIGFAIVR